MIQNFENAYSDEVSVSISTVFFLLSFSLIRIYTPAAVSSSILCPLLSFFFIFNLGFTEIIGLHALSRAAFVEDRQLYSSVNKASIDFLLFSTEEHISGV